MIPSTAEKLNTMAEKKESKLHWPSQSPALNLIEMLCQDVKRAALT